VQLDGRIGVQRYTDIQPSRIIRLTKMHPPEPLDITGLLLRWNAGDAAALEQLTPLVYDELRRLAKSFMQNERPDHTLGATALVHEAYLKLIDERKVDWHGRAHFFGAAANIMRRLLVDHARKRVAAKRGSGVKPAVVMAKDPLQTTDEDLVALDLALGKLGEIDERKSRVVEMKFFAGMTGQEIAEVLSISDATVERDWKMARAWLINSLGTPPAANS
jgi:RNA polymerase sigma-70 factor (ECF subfamily)